MNGIVPASRSDVCACCARVYPAGTPIAWDRSISGWVLSAHRSVAGIYHPSPSRAVTAECA